MSDWGGVRTPANPAPVSGPGAMSARTDGGPLNPNAPAYGESSDLQNLKQAAPMAGPSGASAGGGSAMAGALAQIVGMGDPSQDNRPVTAGADAGAGPGSEALGLPTSPADEKRADVQKLDRGLLLALVSASQRPDATPSFRRLVRTALYL